MAVPQRTLNWLYGVLTKDHYDPQQTYHDPNRAYQDVAYALSQYPSLSPCTDVYTYENGSSALLLHLVGTLPVAFRGTTYRFPVALWIPNTYPREPPMVYVMPTQEMAVRVGQHVTLEGRVYHHYLAHWAEAWDRSTIADLLSILREVFAKEPPVRYRQQMPPLSPTQQTQTPPPIPPLPPGVGSSTRQPQTSSPRPTSQIPPRPPPKPEATAQHPQQPQPQPGPAEGYQSPPVPPLPPKGQDARQSFQPLVSPGSWQSQPPAIVAGQAAGPFRGPPPPAQQRQGQPRSPPMHQGAMSYQRDSTGPTSPGQGPIRHPADPHGFRAPPPTHPSYQPPAAPSHGSPQYPGHQSQPSQHAPRPSGPPYQQQSALPPQYQRPPPAVPAPKKDTPDLLTSPFEVELPSFALAGPAPPIPPNPEKDALLHAVSQTLAETLRANAAQSDSAAQSLVSQSRSLHTAISTLQGEITALNVLHATLQSNTTILQQSIHRADATIVEAHARAASSSGTAAAPADSASMSGLPPIDDVLVAPTVVGKQLYDLVAEEQGLQQALYALQAALVRGIIGVDSWSRHTRGLAREAFLKRALIRKIGRGMGLEESVA